MDEGKNKFHYYGGGKMRTKEQKAAYDKQYMKENVVRKLLAFNMVNDRDRGLLEHLNRQSNITEYIKKLIEEDMYK